MKKLTAGILTVMLGIVAANSADASIASKGYVDAQVKTSVSNTTFESFKTENTANIADAKKAGTDASAALNEYKESNATALAAKADTATMTTELAKKQNKLVSTDNVVINDDNTITLKGIATDTGLADLQKTVGEHTTTLGTLTGDGDGSIAKSIADAVADMETKTNAAATYATQAALTTVDGKFANYTTTADMNTKLEAKADKATVATDLEKKQDKLTAGTNIEIGTDGTISSTYTYNDADVKADITKNANAISAMDTAYKAADTAIDKKIGTVAEGKTVVTMIEEAKTAASGDTTALQTRVKTIEDSAVMASGINADKVAQIETNKTGVASNKTAVEAVTKDLADNYTKTAALSDLAKATIPATCTDPNAANGCALILKNGVYSWEVVERDGEK